MYYGNRQGGSAATFIIVGLVLTALAAGVLYGARQYMTSQRTAPISEESLQIAQQDDEKAAPTEPSHDAQSSTDDASTGATDPSEATSSTESTETPSTEPTDTLPGAATESTTDANTPSAPATPEAPTSSSESTAPTATDHTALILGVTATASVAYLRSQRLI
jgi:Flp pilus assembly protein TadG